MHIYIACCVLIDLKYIDYTENFVLVFIIDLRY